MCEPGNTKSIVVIVPADLSHTGKARFKLADIDECIAPIVRALNNAGILTRGCCCGHGRENGSILLQDGRMLEIHGTITKGAVDGKAQGEVQTEEKG